MMRKGSRSRRLQTGDKIAESTQVFYCIAFSIFRLFFIAISSWICLDVFYSSFTSTATFAATFTANFKLVSTSMCHHVFQTMTAKNAGWVTNNYYGTTEPTEQLSFSRVFFPLARKKNHFFIMHKIDRRLFFPCIMPGMISPGLFMQRKKFKP